MLLQIGDDLIHRANDNVYRAVIADIILNLYMLVAQKRAQKLNTVSKVD